MRKLLMVLVVGLVIATGASYFGMQWKVKKSVDELFQSIPFAEASYSNVSFDLNGKMAVNNIDIYVPMADFSVSVGSVGLSVGGFMEMLSLEKNLKAGKLPDSLKFNINSFSMDITSQMLAVLQSGYTSDTGSELMSLGCGRFTSLGPKQLYDMGLRNLTFDLTLGYTYDLPSDELISTVDIYLDGIGHFIMDQTSIGLSSIMENYNNALFGFDPANVSTSDVHIEYTDLGYNSKQQDFCALSSGMKKSEWVELHEQMFSAAMAQIELVSDFDYLDVYKKLNADRSSLELNLRPLPGFSLGDLQYYNVADLIELIDLRLSINGSQVEIGDINWNQEKLTNLDLRGIRKEYRIGVTKEEVEAEAAEKDTQERILKEVALADLSQYAHKVMQIERKDGQVFSGEMVSVSAEQVVIRTRFKNGFTDLPLPRNQIKVAKLYPE